MTPTNGSNNNNDNTKQDDVPRGATSFVTTSDVLNSINRSLAQLNNHAGGGHFELQRRLPDGSTRPARPEEQRAADCQTAIQQATQLLSSLPTVAAQLEWAEQQRAYGNALYQQQEYEAAMNVYLTCLPAVAPGQIDAVAEETTAPHVCPDERCQRWILYSKLLNNLAQAALQLQWYGKTVSFCTMALDYLTEQLRQQPTILPGDNNNNNNNNNDDAVVTLLLQLSLSPAVNDDRNMTTTATLSLLVSKLYFRRGKARRLRGDYRDAQWDLQQARRLLDRHNDHANHANNANANKCDANHHHQYTNERRAIRREWQALQLALQQGHKHRSQQMAALQNVMNQSSHSNNNTDERHQHASHSAKQGLFPQQNHHPKKTKTHSTLRAVPTARHNNNHHPKDDSQQPSYWHYYLSMVGRVAAQLLEWIGDDDDNKDHDESQKLA